MRASPRAIGATVLGLVCATCIEQRSFPCAEARQCTLAADGVCQPEGYCSYPDTDCPTGQRFESLAPDDLGGECVEYTPCTREEDCNADDEIGVCQAGGDCSFIDDACESGQRYEATVPDLGGRCVPVDVSCAFYCSRFPEVCGEYNPYTDESNCLAQCAQWPTGMAGETEGDSLGCRLNALAQVEDWNPVVNCSRANPTGGDACRSPDAPNCPMYCDRFLMVCNPVLGMVFPGFAYPDREACLTQCERRYPGMVAETPADSVGCRLYHTLAAASLPDPVVMEDLLGLCRAASVSGGGQCVLPRLE